MWNRKSLDKEKSYEQFTFVLVFKIEKWDIIRSFNFLLGKKSDNQKFNWNIRKDVFTKK